LPLLRSKSPLASVSIRTPATILCLTTALSWPKRWNIPPQPFCSISWISLAPPRLPYGSHSLSPLLSDLVRALSCVYFQRNTTPLLLVITCRHFLWPACHTFCLATLQISTLVFPQLFCTPLFSPLFTQLPCPAMVVENKHLFLALDAPFKSVQPGQSPPVSVTNVANPSAAVWDFPQQRPPLPSFFPPF